ncbi:hypothetical protein [Actinoplanes sp. M2I2]|nr:hypothetical protein [Actinoplanes sp. M2I2]
MTTVELTRFRVDPRRSTELRAFFDVIAELVSSEEGTEPATT